MLVQFMSLYLQWSEITHNHKLTTHILFNNTKAWNIQHESYKKAIFYKPGCYSTV